MSVLVGGFGAPKPADAETQALFDTADVKATLSGLLGKEVASLEVTSYSTQVVRSLPRAPTAASPPPRPPSCLH